MKRRPPVLAVALVALLTSAAPAAHAGCGGTQIRHTQHKRNSGRPPLIIGDSVLLGAMRQTTAAGFDLNTRGCRQWSEGMGVLIRYKRAGRLPHLVVMELGTDWTVSVKEIRAAMALLGRDRVLGLVTPREVPGGFGGPDAAHMRAVARRFPGRTLLLDWVAYTRGRGSWFQPDGVHLTLAGAAGFGQFLRTALPYADPPEQVTTGPVEANPPPPTS